MQSRGRRPVKFARGALYARPCACASGLGAFGQGVVTDVQFSRGSTLDCKAAVNHGATPMTFASFLALLPALLGLAAAQPAAPAQQVRRVVIRDEIIIRVPVRVRRIAPDLQWIERKGPKCIHADELRGAMLSGPDSVDFVLRGNRRVRASFDTRCPALDFYGGFYLNTADDKVCSGRDIIRSRVGSGCVIDKFQRLVPRQRH